MPKKIAYKIKYNKEIIKLPDNIRKRNIVEYINENYYLECPECRLKRYFNYSWQSQKLLEDGSRLFDLDDAYSLVCYSCRQSITLKNTWKTHYNELIDGSLKGCLKSWEDPDRRERHSNRLSLRNKINWTDSEYRRYHTYIFDLIKELTLTTIDQSKETTVYYAKYINDDSVFKVGITNNIDIRSGHHSENLYYEFIEIRKFDNRYYAALCEFDAKLNFCNLHEFIDKNAILDYIKFINDWSYDPNNYTENIVKLLKDHI